MGLTLTWATVKLHTFYFINKPICTQNLHVCVKVRSPSYIITYRSRRAFKNSDITILEHVKQCGHETFLDIIWRERKCEKYHGIFCCWFTSRQSMWCRLFQIIIYNSFFPLFIVLQLFHSKSLFSLQDGRTTTCFGSQTSRENSLSLALTRNADNFFAPGSRQPLKPLVQFRVTLAQKYEDLFKEAFLKWYFAFEYFFDAHNIL